MALNVECGRRLKESICGATRSHAANSFLNSHCQLTRPPVAMASFDKDGVSPALQVTIIIGWSRLNCSFQAKSVLDAFEELNESEETKKVLLGYMTRATVAERTFSSQGGYTVVPDEESKKLIINQAVERDGETFLGTQVSLAPTHASKLVGPLVRHTFGFPISGQ